MKPHEAFNLLSGGKSFSGPERRVTVFGAGREPPPAVLRRGEVPAGAPP